MTKLHNREVFEIMATSALEFGFGIGAYGVVFSIDDQVVFKNNEDNTRKETIDVWNW